MKTNNHSRTTPTPALASRSELAHQRQNRVLLTADELAQIFQGLNIPPAGQAAIRRIRDSDPSRATRSNKVSGKLRYVPLKMPFVIEAEAFETEYAAIVEWDHDDVTLEFYPQTEALKITYVGQHGRKITTYTKADYLRIEKSKIVFVECKSETKLITLQKESPNRYCRRDDGSWFSPPGDIAAQALGCSFELRSSSQNNWTLTENMELLKDYFCEAVSPVTESVRQTLLGAIAKEGWLRIYDVVHGELSLSADDLYAMLVDGTVYFPLLDRRLSDQDYAFVYRDAQTYHAFSLFHACHLTTCPAGTTTVSFEANSTFTWDGQLWQVINPGINKIFARHLAGDGQENYIELEANEILALIRAGRIQGHHLSQVDRSETEERLRHANPEDMQEAVWRYEILKGIQSQENPLAGRAPRTIMYWKRAFREAEEQFGNGFVGLLPHRTGNRAPRAQPASLELARQMIASDWETIRRKQRFATWGHYCNRCEETHLIPVSYVTFCKFVKERSGYKQKKARVGEAAAYDLEPQYLELEFTTPRHGVRIWHVAHIDHTPIPLKFVHSKLAKSVDTIWLTFLIDAYSRKILAYYLTFDPPSYRSCMMVIRDCVRRHNKVPQIVVSDQGPDFVGTYYETLLAFLEITKRERRAKKPRSGSVIERLFKTSQSQFISNLLGSTDIVEKYFRSVSPEVEPARHAVWCLDRFDAGMEEYMLLYHGNHHLGLGSTPDEVAALSLKSHGLRSHRMIAYDQQFIAQTCPAAPRGKAKVGPQGFKCNYTWYHCDAFLRPGVLNTDVFARYDPFNFGVAYAFVHGQWQKCISEHYAMLSQYTERVVRIASERIRFMDRLAGKRQKITAQRLATFLENREGEEEIARQLLNDEESMRHRSKIVIADTPDPNEARSSRRVHGQMSDLVGPLEDL